MLTGDMGQAGALVKRMQATQAALKELHEAQQAQAEASVSQAQHAAASGVNASVWVGLGTGVAVLLALGVASWLIVASVWRDLGGEPAHLREIVQRVSDGDLDVSLRAEPGDSRSLNAALAGMVGKLRETVRSIRQATDSIADASGGIATGNEELSARTESTASNLQQTASSMEQLTATVRHSADAAQQANGLANTATQAARRGGDIVGGVVSSMAEIDDASRRIGEIIGVIDSIAFQTNILALNAAVEAARAGEQGRGFAVVASEVRSLAQRSAQAAREIKTLIGASSEKVESGSKLVQDAGAAMTEILGGVERVTDIIGRISSATAEQSTGIGQVNSAVSELDRMTQQNAALVQQSAASDAEPARADAAVDAGGGRVSAEVTHPYALRAPPRGGTAGGPAEPDPRRSLDQATRKRAVRKGRPFFGWALHAKTRCRASGHANRIDARRPRTGVPATAPPRGPLNSHSGDDR